MASNAEVPLGESDLRKAVRDLYANESHLAPRQFRETLEQQLAVSLANHKDLIKDEIALLRDSAPARKVTPVQELTNSKYAYSPSANDASLEGGNAADNERSSVRIRRGSTFRALSVGIQDILSEKSNQYIVSHHDHHISYCKFYCCCKLGIKLFEFLAFLEHLQALALVNLVWPTIEASDNMLRGNNSGSVALPTAGNISPANLWDIWRFLARTSSLDYFFENSGATLLVPLACATAIFLWLFPLFVFCRWRKRRFHLKNAARRAARFREEIVEGRREQATRTRGEEKRRARERKKLEKQVRMDLREHEAETSGRLDLAGAFIAFSVTISTHVLQIPGSILAARLLLCGLGQPGIANCVGFKEAPSQGLFMALFVLVMLPLALTPFAIFVTVRRAAPHILSDDPIFGANSGFLQTYADIKYDDILFHDLQQLQNPFRVLYLTQRRAFNQERAFSAIIKTTTVLCVFHLSDLALRQAALFVSFLTAAVLSVIFRSIYREASIQRIIISAMTLGVLLSIFAMANEQNTIPDHSSNLNRVAGVIFYVHFAVVAGVFLRVGRFKRKCCGTRVLFENAATCEVGLAQDIIPGWEPVEEIMARIWKPFWTKLIESSYGGRVSKHFHRMRARASEPEAIQNHFIMDSETSELRKYVVDHIEGVDAYYVPQDVPREKLAEMTTTGFGRLDVQPFPWAWKITYDDSGHVHEGPMGLDGLKRLVKQNKSSVVKLRRENRRVLRALSSDGVLVKYKYREGRKEEFEKALVDADLEFNIGRLRIVTADGTRYSHGFKVSMEYDDGHGYGSVPGKFGQVIKFEDKRITIGLEDLGLTHLFDVEERSNLVDEHGNELRSIIEEGLPLVEDPNNPGEFIEKKIESLSAALNQFYEQWRADLQQQRSMEEQLFPSSFFYHVYNAPLVDRKTLEEYFASLCNSDLPHASNIGPCSLANIPEDHGEGLRVLYSRMHHLQRHPSSAVWFFFWNDVWERNRDLVCMRGLKKILNPNKSDALCYTVLKRPALEAKLRQYGVMRQNKYCKSGPFGAQELDELYNAVHQYKEWREMSHTQAAQEHASSLDVVDMRSEDEKRRHRILDPLLQRRRKRIAVQAGASSGLIGTGKVGTRTENQHVRDSLLALVALTLGIMAVGITCVAEGNPCASIHSTGSTLLIALPPIGLALIFAGIVYWKAKSAKLYSNSKVGLRLSGDESFDESESPSKLLEEAHIYLRRGKKIENGRTAMWELHAYKMYHASRVRLDALPLVEVYEDVCFAIDREAACVALQAGKGLDADVEKFSEARDLYVRLANIWNNLKSNASVAGEADHHVALSLHKAFLCALGARDSWTANEVVKLGLTLGEDAFELSPQCKRMRLTLEIFSNFDVDGLALAIVKWEDEWHLSRWMKQMHAAILSAMKASREAFIKSAQPDEDATLENCKYLLHLSVVGDQGAGKTSMCVRWMYSSFVPNPTQVTQGRKHFHRTEVLDDGTRVRVHLHDVSTISEMMALRNLAHGVFLLYDSQSDAAFVETSKWLHSKQHMFAKFTLVGARADDSDAKRVRTGKMLALAKEHSMDHAECSAKTGDGVEEAFKAMLARIVLELDGLNSAYKQPRQ